MSAVGAGAARDGVEGRQRRLVGFVGVGTMGARMASNLTADDDVVVVDATPGVADRVAAEIGARAGTSADLSEAAAVILMLPNSAIVDAVLDGSGDDAGLLSRLREGALVIDMSSSDPVHTRENARRAAEHGVRLIDAPVSGGPQGAEAGTLSIMVGGAEEDIAAAMPLLERLGGRITAVGGVGAGHAVKALNNLLAATNLAAAAEVATAGRRFGLDPAVLMSVILSSSGASTAGGLIPEHVLTGRYAFGFSAALMAKDVATGRALIDSLSLELPVTKTTEEVWTAALDDPADYRDMTHIAAYIEAHASPEQA